MEQLLNLYAWILTNKMDLINAVAYLIAAATIVVKLTPTLKDDNFFKPIIKFIGKYIALDKYGPNGE